MEKCLYLYSFIADDESQFWMVGVTESHKSCFHFLMIAFNLYSYDSVIPLDHKIHFFIFLPPMMWS